MRSADILTLAQWFSPAYPVGAFSYSHGLEWAIDVGSVDDVKTLGAWVVDVIEHGTGRNDALFLAAAHQAETSQALVDIDQTCRAFAASSERLSETVQQGAAFCQVTSAIWSDMPEPLSYPVAVGHATRVQALDPVLAAAMYLHAFAGNLATVGMRLIPLGQTEGHGLIRALAEPCQRIAAETAHGSLDALSSSAFLADIAAMKHETQYSRIFRT